MVGYEILTLWRRKLLMESDKGSEARKAFKRLVQAKQIGRSAIEIAVEEAMTWDVFRWTVIVLLVLNFIFTSLFYSGASPQLTAQDRLDYASELGALRAELKEQLAQATEEMAADLVAVRFGLRQPVPQMESEPTTTGSIEMPSVPRPAKSPRRH